MNFNEDTINNLKGICTIDPLPVYGYTRTCEQLSVFTSREHAPDCKCTLPVSVSPLLILLMGEYIKRNVLKQTQDVGGRQHKILLEDNFADRKKKKLISYTVLFIVSFALKQHHIRFLTLLT